METTELRSWLHDHWPEVRAALDAGTYRPQPTRRVTIPKPSGGERKLGVPTALDRFFERVQHDALMARVARRVTDKKVRKLIRAYLEAGVMADGVKQPTEEGTPQGSPLSPLLSNACLDDLDRMLERRGCPVRSSRHA